SSNIILVTAAFIPPAAGLATISHSPLIRLRLPLDSGRMSSAGFHARRAILDDIKPLQSMWASMQYDTEGLARRITEFQVVEHPDYGLLGAVGLQILQKEGC